MLSLEGGVSKAREVIEKLARTVYKYNTEISSSGYYLKPVHYVYYKNPLENRVYAYIAKYWWKLSYIGKKGRTSKIKWFYVGTVKPPELPPPPIPPTLIVLKKEAAYISLEAYNTLSAMGFRF